MLVVEDAVEAGLWNLFAGMVRSFGQHAFYLHPRILVELSICVR